MNDRERMLRELNLYPIWVRRDAPADAAQPTQTSSTAEPGHPHEGEAALAPGARGGRAPVVRTHADSSNPAAPGVLPAPPVSAPTQESAHASVLSGDATSSAQTAADDARARAIAVMTWPELKQAVQACTACPLHTQRKQSVFGVGDEAADWLFVGEGPGAEEDARGEPFVGQAGRLLDNMLAALGLSRGQDVYIANVVKCRPPGNRTPQPLEARCCEPFLERQIALLRPRLIVALGKTAAENLLRREASIASLRGRLHDYNGIGMIVTYHPAYLLRTLADKAKAWEDLCFARDTMQRLKSGDAGPN